MRSATPRRLPLTLLAAIVGAAGLYVWRGPGAAATLAVCALVTGLLIPAVARFAFARGMLAFPGGRDVHARPTPHGGGIALAVPVFALLIVLGATGHAPAWGLLAGGAIIFAVGVLDDMRRASPRLKILSQMLAGAALLLAGYRLPALDLPGLGTLELGWAEAPVLVFWIVLATNAFNLSDGLDGLATSLAILGLAVLTAAGVGGLLPVALAGACLGFLHYNLPTARMFLGDTGSLLLGFLLAALALTLPLQGNLPIAVAALAYSLGDVAIVVFRRWIRAKPLFAPDSSHVHHKVLAAAGGRPLATLLVILLIGGVQGVVAVAHPGVVSLVVSGLVWIVVAAVLIRAGHYRARGVLDGRRTMRELHLLRRYVVGSLELARRAEHVDRCLRHLAESADLCALAVGGHVVRRPQICGERMLEHAATVAEGETCTVHLLETAAGLCWWRARPGMLDGALERERATIAKDALLAAVAAYERLGGVPAVAVAPEASHPPLAGAVR